MIKIIIYLFFICITTVFLISIRKKTWPYIVKIILRVFIKILLIIIFLIIFYFFFHIGLTFFGTYHAGDLEWERKLVYFLNCWKGPTFYTLIHYLQSLCGVKIEIGSKSFDYSTIQDGLKLYRAVKLYHWQYFEFLKIYNNDHIFLLKVLYPVNKPFKEFVDQGHNSDLSLIKFFELHNISPEDFGIFYNSYYEWKGLYKRY